MPRSSRSTPGPIQPAGNQVERVVGIRKALSIPGFEFKISQPGGRGLLPALLQHFRSGVQRNYRFYLGRYLPGYKSSAGGNIQDRKRIVQFQQSHNPREYLIVAAASNLLVEGGCLDAKLLPDQPVMLFAAGHL